MSNIKKAVDFFSPYLKEKCYISFYGGEPLLAFENIRETVNYIEGKNLKKDIEYVLTTNGSLLDESILRFFDRYKFSLRLSFDGLVQEVARKKGSFEQILANLRKILDYPGIDFDTNSVFTPETVKDLSKSIRFITELGVPKIKFSLSTLARWDQAALDLFKKECEAVRRFLIPVFKKTGSVPVVNFIKSKHRGIFACYAGKTRMALAPDGKLWGCFLFWDYFRTREKTKNYDKYCFGELAEFINNRERIYGETLAKYAKLRMDHYCISDSFCMLCDELEECMICPVDAAFSGAIMGNVPAHLCEINKIERRERELFRKELES
jgi:sulfatase maturation enzyme AslB (radical SAM superfamily)